MSIANILLDFILSILLSILGIITKQGRVFEACGTYFYAQNALTEMETLETSTFISVFPPLIASWKYSQSDMATWYAEKKNET
jgi:phage gp46-like protein